MNNGNTKIQINHILFSLTTTFVSLGSIFFSFHFWRAHLDYPPFPPTYFQITIRFLPYIIFGVVLIITGMGLAKLSIKKENIFSSVLFRLKRVGLFLTNTITFITGVFLLNFGIVLLLHIGSLVLIWTTVEELISIINSR